MNASFNVDYDTYR